MIIDFHTHTFPDHMAEKTVTKLGKSCRIYAFSDGTQEGLRRNEEKAGIDLAVIQPVATTAHAVPHINDSAIRINQNEKETTGTRLLSFGCIHPEYGDYQEELHRIAEAGVPGIKLHPYFHGCDMDDIRYLRILDAATENGLIVLTHAGYDQGFPGEHNCTVPMLRKAALSVKGITLIAAHMGGWKEWEQVPDLLADTGIYLDSSFAVGHIRPEEGAEAYWNTGSFKPDPGMLSCREREVLSKQTGESTGDPDKGSSCKRMTGFQEEAKRRCVFGNTQLLKPEEFVAIVRAFPKGHVVFATDSPWSDPAESISFIRSAPLSEEETEDILGRTAQKLLRYD